ARSSGAQVVAASHSEVILNEAADRDVVVAFVGAPHRIDDRGSQVAKSLKSIGFEDYVKAEETGWVLYLEGATDLAILAAFARTLRHRAAPLLERPFVKYIENQPKKARDHFYGVRVAKSDLVGFVLTDNLGHLEEGGPELPVRQWLRREIENYLCFPDVLVAYAESLAAARAPGPLFADTEVDRFRDTMNRIARERIPPAAFRDRGDRWWSSVKASDDFLDPVFEEFFKELGLPNLMRKSDYHRLAGLVPAAEIAPEVAEVLDAIAAQAARARPVQGDDE
ncbi:MAG: AAA family ATPase, partial [Deltaproteobacteria bacterium]|nr:AAA family ATPase [Deltaproteobacteria bacterium]